MFEAGLAEAVAEMRRMADSLRLLAGPEHDAAMAGIVRSPKLLHSAALSALSAALSGKPEDAVVNVVALLGALHEQRGDRRAALQALSEAVEEAALELERRGITAADLPD